MRDVPWISNAWRSGRFIGDTRPSTRVTLEPHFSLAATDPTVGTWTRGPARWYQRYDTSQQFEVEVPNVASVNIQRALDSDAGTCDITITNIRMPSYGEPLGPLNVFGEPGFFTWDHGDALEARARWGHLPNNWHHRLVPNSLLRTYQGFGGQDKEIAQAVTDGNLVLNGVWLVDTIDISTEGNISIKCRDMGKLLLDQYIFPPMVSRSIYPLRYERFRIVNFTVPPDPVPSCDPVIANCVYAGSSTDQVYGGFNTNATGHPGSEAFDWSPTWEPPGGGPGDYAHQRTYWMSEPRNSPNDTVWIEFTCDGAPPVNTIYWHSWGGLYRIMVSVFEGGEWVAPEASGQGGWTPEGLPYVSTFTVRWEPAPGVDTNQYELPREYRAERIRLTLTNLIAAQEGGYRGGARKIIAQYVGCKGDYPRLTFTGGTFHGTSQQVGYWQTRSDGSTYAFGDARILSVSTGGGGPASHQHLVVDMTATIVNANGYWTLDTAGRIVAYGLAYWYGDDFEEGRNDAVSVAARSSGDGYWILHKNGDVSAHGAAPTYSDVPVTGTVPSGAPVIARAIAAHPTSDGYWVLWSDGTVQAFGAATNYGNATMAGFTPTEYCTDIAATSTGVGYWVLSGSGRVQPFGDAPDNGSVTSASYLPDRWSKGLCWTLVPFSDTDYGYFIGRADGTLVPCGDFDRRTFGDVATGGQLRFDGSYKDYSDIIKELLLWAGFYLERDPQPGTQFPDVYGNIESTGAYAEDALPVDMFDKKTISEAIKAIRDIVGYVFYVDPEGGARFESPHWWMMGNFLIDGTPYQEVPEIDEAVNLTHHAISFSATDARSEIIIATEDPYPTDATLPDPTGITITRIVPLTKPDLKGMIKPGMWTNGLFLKPAEQKVMADLLDMRMWFERRTAQIQCVANPLIDLNDQVRVIERQTGDVYIHFVRGISISHDLTSGEFNMNLTTHWLGGSPFGNRNLYFTCAARPQGDGYWQASLGGQAKYQPGDTPPEVSSGGIRAFGSALLYPPNEPETHLVSIITMRSTHSGLGYYTMDVTGKIISYGDAAHRGDLRRAGNDAIDFALTPSGNGYWILLTDGTVIEFGDAASHGSPSISGTMPAGGPRIATSIESHPSTQGYWVLDSMGTVYGYNLTEYGDADRAGFSRTEYVHRLRRSHSGNGYWIVSGGAIVQAFGDAPDLGNGRRYPDEDWVSGLVWDFMVTDSNGYGLQHADGTVDHFNLPDYGEATGTGFNIIWALMAEADHATLVDPTDAFPVSTEVMRFLRETGSPSANNAAANNFNAPIEPTFKAPS